MPNHLVVDIFRQWTGQIDVTLKDQIWAGSESQTWDTVTPLWWNNAGPFGRALDGEARVGCMRASVCVCVCYLCVPVCSAEGMRRLPYHVALPPSPFGSTPRQAGAEQRLSTEIEPNFKVGLLLLWLLVAKLQEGEKQGEKLNNWTVLLIFKWQHILYKATLQWSITLVHNCHPLQETHTLLKDMRKKQHTS